MTTHASTLRRRLVLITIFGLMLVALPVTPVIAVEVAPETVSEVLHQLAEGQSKVPHTEEAETANDARPDGDEHVVESEIKEASIPFNNLGIKAAGSPRVWFRTMSLEGDWRPWNLVEPLDDEDGPDPGSEEARDATATHAGWTSDAIWVGDSTHVQLRIADGMLEDLEVHTIDSMGLSESLWQRVGRTLRGVVTPPAAEAASYPGLVTRRQWGANESLRRGSPSYATVRFAVLHHTAGSNSYTRAEAPGIVRGIYHWHTQGNGWADVGYNILVDRYGTVYEGRHGGVDRGVIGAHAANFNTGSFGVGVLGNFDVASVPAAAFTATTDVMAWKYQVHGLATSSSARVSINGRSLPILVGHRDVGTTACPGRYFYSRLGELRSGIASKVAGSTPQPGPTPPPPPAPDPQWKGPIPVLGDWNGDRVSTPGWFHDGTWTLSNRIDGSEPFTLRYGKAGDKPVVGDWNGDGRDTVGVVRDRQWILRRTHSRGDDIIMTYGRATDDPIAGDWNGDGRDTIGVVRDNNWLLRYEYRSGADIVMRYGRPSDIPVTGDWNGDGRDTIGVVRDDNWLLRYAYRSGADITTRF